MILKALADESRLRILAALSREPLSVNELLDVVQMGQSRVSRHLKILSDAGLLEFERLGPRVYYGFHRAAGNGLGQRLLAALGLPRLDGRPALGLPAEVALDGERLEHLLENRRQDGLEHFQKYGIDQDQLQREFVDAGFYRELILEALPADVETVVDVGCGAGVLAERLSERGLSVIGIDPSSNLLSRARRNCPEGDFRSGSLERLPLDDAGADLVIAAMVLHHLPDPVRGLREIFRVLRPGGRLLIAELVRHDEDSMTTRFADFWPGFEPDRLEAMLAEAGFAPGRVERGRGSAKLETVLVSATKMGAVTGRRRPARVARWAAGTN